jgi:E1A-binding protein p400
VPVDAIKQLYSSAASSEDPFDTDPRYPIDPAALAYVNQLRAQKLHWRVSRATHASALNALRTQKQDFALFGADQLRLLKLDPLPRDIHALEADPRHLPDLSSALSRAVRTNADRAEQMQSDIEHVCCIVPRARAKPAYLRVSRPNHRRELEAEERTRTLQSTLSPTTDIFRASFARQQIFFPDKYLLQYDAGKLQKLAELLRERHAGGHRVLIFSQFSKMLDILESFLSMHGYKYLRLDGATKVEDRARLMERFNRSNKYFVFILSTRSGGIGINLTGADSVVMYDSDWNPAIVSRHTTHTG